MPNTGIITLTLFYIVIPSKNIPKLANIIYMYYLGIMVVVVTME